MGGLDECEPPLKRFKDSAVELESTINNSFHSEPIIPFGGSMARSLPSQGKEVMVGSKGGIKRAELVRLITKTLYSFGYAKSGKVLEEESGIDLDSSSIILLRKQVLDGNWDESVVTLQKIGLNEQILQSASLLIREYKFFILLEKDGVMDALKTLRSEIAPLKISKKRLHELSSCIVFPLQHALHGFANFDIDSGKVQSKLLEELQNLLPPAVIIPERRLENLVEQALCVQRDACFFHNPLEDTLSLYMDHQCGKDRLPLRTVQDSVTSNGNTMEAAFLANLLYWIWHNRNAMLHGKLSLPAAYLVYTAAFPGPPVVHLNHSNRRWNPFLPTGSPTLNNSWVPSPHGWLKVNFDGDR